MFTSGNAPLLKVIRESLARAYQQSQDMRIADARRHSEALLHSVHSFIEEGERSDAPPTEKVVIFDEAQRAWDKAKMEKMKAKQRKYNADKGLPAPSDSIESEPYNLLSIMGRSKGSVIVALCGNGQEIHDGEAGIDEWVRSAGSIGGWEVVASPVIQQGLGDLPQGASAIVDALHLTVPLRSHHATTHAEWVHAVLSGQPEQARNLIDQKSLPILVTRSMEQAREFF